MTDVLISAPTARAGVKATSLEPPSPEELARLYYQEIQVLKRDMKTLGDTTSQIASVALGLLKMICDFGYASEKNMVTIPKWLHDQMLGASIEVGETETGDISVRLRESGRERVVVSS